MKIIWNGIKAIVVGVWLIVAIFVTICLLSYNDYSITVMNKNSFLIIDNEDMEPDYKDGDLVIVKKQKNSEINEGDKVFFYNDGNNVEEVPINMGTVTGKETVTNTETTYEIEGKLISSQYVIGKANGAKIYHNLGMILGILTSRWGYMFIVILPTLFGVVYEVILIVDEVKKNKKKETATE